MNHTPGPWRYEPSTNTIRSVPTNYWLATMDSWDGAVNHPANARLIAAAPDLLKALQTIEKAFVESMGDVRYADYEHIVLAALAKATAVQP